MKIIARHKWVSGATITESAEDTKPRCRRFTATIRGFQNWKIFEGYLDSNTGKNVKRVVTEIRDKIDSGDEDVFFIKDYSLKEGR